MTSNEIFETVKEYTKDNFHADIYLDEFCVLMDLSERTVQRALAEHNTSWSYLLSRVRLIMASEMLQTTDMSVRDVACECGYKSLTNFNRTFKKFWGSSPREFRQQYTGDSNE